MLRTVLQLKNVDILETFSWRSVTIDSDTLIPQFSNRTQL